MPPRNLQRHNCNAGNLRHKLFIEEGIFLTKEKTCDRIHYHRLHDGVLQKRYPTSNILTTIYFLILYIGGFDPL